MKMCAELIVENGQVKNIIRQMSCDPQTVVEYPNWLILGGIGVGLLLLWFLWLYPLWNIWNSRKAGLAELAEAENAERVAIAEANARVGAAEANKRAEVIEAEAVAESIHTIGDALEKNPSYNRFQWIRMMEGHNNNNVIYVPTEANLPILEATRTLQQA